MEDNTEYYSFHNVVDTIRSFFFYLKKRILWLALVFFIGCGLGVLYYYIQSPKYKAACTFILDEKTSAGGGLSSLASQFGVNLGSLSGTGSMFAGDNILDILRSKKVVERVLLSRVEKKSSDISTLADLYLQYTGLQKQWKKNLLLAAVNFRNAKEQELTPLQDSVLNVIHERLIKKNLSTERTSKQGTIIKVEVTAPNAVFSRLMTERLVDEASKLYLDIRIGTAQENIRQLQRRSDSLLLLLNNKSYTTAARQPLDINPGVRTAVVPLEIATRDKTVLATLYGEVTKNLEASKLLLSQQTPVIQVLDEPAYLLDDNKKGLPVLLIVGSFATVIVYTSVLFILFLFKRTDLKNKN
jgi:uncharacterized protein involved in exopolysaccharide biosynthesis